MLLTGKIFTEGASAPGDDSASGCCGASPLTSQRGVPPAEPGMRAMRWSGRRESNPRNQLGRLGLYH